MNVLAQIGSTLRKFAFWGAGAIGGAFGWVSWLFKNGRVDYRKEAGRIYDNSAVLPAINFLWRNLQYPRLIVTRKVKGQSGRGKWEEIEDHPFPLAVQAGPFYDQTILWYGTIVSWIVDGNAYWYKVRSAAGLVVGYVYIPHFQIWPMADRGNEDGTKLVTYYEYHPAGGTPQFFLPEDIVHFRHGIDPENQMRGLSPLMAALREIVGDNEAGVLGTSLMLNAGITAIAFSPKEGGGKIDPDKWDDAKKRWRENSTGEMAGTPNYIPFPVDAVNLGFKPSELVLDTHRALFVSRICAGTGFDPMVLGLPSEQKTYSNYEEAIDAATKNTILPTLRIFGTQLSYATLVPDFGGKPGERVDWDLSEVPALAEEENEKWDRVSHAWESGLITRADGRRAVGLDVDEAKDNVYKTDLDLGGPADAAQKTAIAKVKQQLKEKMKRQAKTYELVQADVQDE